MALSHAQRQARYRAKQDFMLRNNPDVMLRELQAEIERAQRGECPDAERVALAERLADLALQHQWRAHALAKLAMKVRANEREVGAAWWQDEIVPRIAQR
jgi:hypothetical protein